MERLKKMLSGQGKFVEFDRPIKELKESNVDLGIPLEDIVKSIVYVTKDKQAIIAVVPLTERVDTRKLADALNLKRRPTIAGPDGVFRLTSYVAGAVPPINAGIRTVIDPKVMEKEFVYGGGGKTNNLLGIRPRLIVELTKATIADVTKDVA